MTSVQTVGQQCQAQVPGHSDCKRMPFNSILLLSLKHLSRLVIRGMVGLGYGIYTLKIGNKSVF